MSDLGPLVKAEEEFKAEEEKELEAEEERDEEERSKTGSMDIFQEVLPEDPEDHWEYDIELATKLGDGFAMSQLAA